MIAHKHFLFSLVLLSFLPFTATAQKPDFLADTLYVVGGKEQIQNKQDIKASLKVFCDGEYISMIINVKDDQMTTNASDIENDHIEVWMALPFSAFPSNFEYNFHPRYVYSPAENNPYEKSAKNRFFSVYSEYASSLTLNGFVKEYDYPTSAEIAAQKLNVPKRETLKECRIDYGMVHYGFYPDGRTPTHLNKNNYALLEKALGVKMGNFMDGVKYVAEKYAGGYTLTLQFSPQALGFVQLPVLSEMRFMVDVFDKDGGSAATILSSSQFRKKDNPMTFNTVRFKRPLHTNSTNIPDAVFSKLDFNPVYTYTDSTWVGTSVETDLAAYGKDNLSKSVIEVKFMKQPIKYAGYEDLSHNNIKHLTVDKGAVNTRNMKMEYFIINGQVFESEVAKVGKKGREEVLNQTFVFPDGSAGLVLKTKTAVNAYGWGNCPNCYEEIVSFIRVKGSESKTVLAIYQGNSGEPYCQIGDKNYKGFFVTELDWLREGKVMIFRLSNHDGSIRKRVKVSWDNDGSRIAMNELP